MTNLLDYALSKKNYLHSKYKNAKEKFDLIENIVAKEEQYGHLVTRRESVTEYQSLNDQVNSFKNQWELWNKIYEFVRDHSSVLDISGLQLTKEDLIELPKELLSEIKELNLSGNLLSTLPSQIGLLSNLECLIIESCDLAELPSEIGHLSNLKELNLTNNKLRSLPKEIGSLESLEKLDLSFNTGLRELPIEFGNLTNLKELLLSDNYFDENYVSKLLIQVGFGA